MTKRSLPRFLVDLLLGGPPHKPRKPLPEILTMPVIFANGRDVDDEGIKTYLENRPVMFRGQVIGPGNHRLDQVDLRFSVSSIWLIADGRLIGVVGQPLPGRPVLYAAVGHGFNRALTGRVFAFNAEVLP